MLEIYPSIQKKSSLWLGPHCEVSCEFEYLVEFAAILENLYYISKAQVLTVGHEIFRRRNLQEKFVKFGESKISLYLTKFRGILCRMSYQFL
jgi:hypothetical protein